MQTACRMDLFARARERGIQTDYIDGQGHRHVTDAAALQIIVDALPVRIPNRFLDQAVVVRLGQPSRTEFSQTASLPLRWKIVAGAGVIADGEAHDRNVVWPADLPVGSHRLHLTDVSGYTEQAPLIVAPARGFGGDFDRCWLLAVQLYGVRSARNWGIGDFTDLEALIELAASLGADGVGLNPLHALFDDRPGDCSPYSPNSRLFLNPLYVDVEKLPGFQRAAETKGTVAGLRAGDTVNYDAVADVKWRALRFAFDSFKANPKGERKQDFEDFAPSVRPCCRGLPVSRYCGIHPHRGRARRRRLHPGSATRRARRPTSPRRSRLAEPPSVSATPPRHCCASVRWPAVGSAAPSASRGRWARPPPRISWPPVWRRRSASPRASVPSRDRPLWRGAPDGFRRGCRPVAHDGPGGRSACQGQPRGATRRRGARLREGRGRTIAHP